MTWEMPELESLQDHARMMHELYLSLKAEGFSCHEALHIIMGQACCPESYTEEDDNK